MADQPYDTAAAIAKIAEWELLARTLGDLAGDLEEKVDQWRHRACDAELQAKLLRDRLQTDARIDGEAPR